MIHTETKAPDSIRVLAVDADIVAWRCSAVSEGESEDDLKSTVDNFLYTIVECTGVNEMKLFLTPKTNFRYKLAITKPYKGNRKDGYRPEHLTTAKEYMKERYGAMIIEGYEADDCIASMMTKYEGAAHAGIDKDIKQIAGWHFDFVKHTWHYTDEDESALRIYRQVCQGDTTDNIPGLKGVGEKKAARFVTEPDRAREQALAAYKAKLAPMPDDDIVTYFSEQEMLIRMITTLNIPFDPVTVEVPPPLLAEEEEGFEGFDE